MKFNKKEIIRLWGNGLPLRVNYKDYKVYKMSYGQYFLEPANIEVRETEGFSKDVIWLINNKDNINILEVDINE